MTIRALSAFPGLVLVEGGFRRRQVERILMIAGGSGMAPLLSMLANLAEKGNTPSRHLLLRARRLQDLYRLERNRELQAAMPVLEFVPVLSDEWPQDWSGESGLVSEVVARRMGSLEGYDAYLCGPPPMIDAATPSCSSGASGRATSTSTPSSRPETPDQAVPSGRRPSSWRTILVPATRLRSLRKATSRAS